MVHKTFTSLIVAVLTSGIVLASVQAKEIKWGSNQVGATGYQAITTLTDLLNRKLADYRFTVHRTPGAIFTIKGYATGKFEGYLGSDIAFYELANNINRFKGFKKKMKRPPVQSFWAYTFGVGVGIRARDKGEIKQWRDLHGKRVFTGPDPWDTRALLERAFKVLGMEHEYVEVHIKTAFSHLDMERLDALGVYTTAEATTAPWISEGSLQTDWAALNPSPEEVRLLEKAGFDVVQMSTSVFGKEKTHVKKLTALELHYGIHLGLEVSANDLYRILKIIEKNAAELAKVNKAFKQVEKDMPGIQRRGVESAANFVPIHPGLAKYMREKGVWDSKWDSRIANVE
jgi:TRAP-type uncharacterized transport system substrate-binding protein